MIPVLDGTTEEEPHTMPKLTDAQIRALGWVADKPADEPYPRRDVLVRLEALGLITIEWHYRRSDPTRDGRRDGHRYRNHIVRTQITTDGVAAATAGATR